MFVSDEKPSLADKFFWPVVGIATCTLGVLGCWLAIGFSKPAPQQVTPRQSHANASAPTLSESTKDNVQFAQPTTATKGEKPLAPPPGMYDDAVEPQQVAQTPVAPTSTQTSTATTPNSNNTYLMGANGPRGPPAVNGVAENGVHYGDTSTITGKPKTVEVRGYYRKDGTYVRGHYRSK